MRAYPEEPVAQTTLRQVPMQWVYRTLNAPVGELVTETIEGTWSGASRRSGDVPILDAFGLLADAQIPPSIPRFSDLPVVPPSPEVTAHAERVLSHRVPIFAARVAAAKADNAPVAAVFVGSSTTAEHNDAAGLGYVGPLGRILQDAYLVDSPSAVQYSTDAIFTERTEAGLHVYGAGEGSTTSATFLTDAECDRIAALKPALIHVQVGSNDFRAGMDPETYRTNMLARLAYLRAALTEPCQIVLVQQYERPQGSLGPYSWAEYGQVLEEIAASDPVYVYFDIDPFYAVLGLPTVDPLGFIRADTIHQTARGYQFMVDVKTAFYLAA